ncbi:MAG: type II and III secretion system protein family protein [Desulfobacterales bacterium]
MSTPFLQAQEPETLTLTRGKSKVIKQFDPAKRVSIADPEIADFVLISPREIYLTGKQVGTTNLTVWQKKGDYRIYDLEVVHDISQLKKQLNEILPQETGLRVTAANQSLTLSGRVSSAASLNQALALAQSHAPGGNITNLVDVGGIQQVMLEVRVAEMQRSLTRRLGINFDYVTSSGKFGISRLGGLTDVVSPDDANIFTPVPGDGYPGISAPFGTFVSPSVNALLRFNANNTNWTFFIDALKSDGLVKVLAEPTLIALSGNDAYFLAGGEFPVPVPQGLGTVAIEYKSFGVGLTFKPTVLSDNRINIDVTPEVSELDFASAIQFSGFIVPGLSTRKAHTVVELADGQSFAIAGLLRDTARDAMDKFPLLGDLPIIGSLFRSRAFQKNETELVIIVTPHLVNPLNTANQPLPTDFYTEPDALDFYLLGRMEGREKDANSGMTGELDGEFGHAYPGEK